MNTPAVASPEPTTPDAPPTEGRRVHLAVRAERIVRVCPEAGLSLDVKADTGTVSGYAATWLPPDSVGDIIRPGAFQKSIAERSQVPVLSTHLANGATAGDIVATATTLRQDATGLFFEARFASTEYAQSIRALCREGHISHASIGYRVLRSRSLAGDDRSDGARRELVEVALYEITLTAFPAQPATTVSAKNDGPCGRTIRLVMEPRVKIVKRRPRRTKRRR